MNKDFLLLILDRTHFPAEAKDELCRCFDILADGAFASDFENAVQFFFDSDLDIKQTEERLNDIAQRSEISVYTVWLLLLLLAAERVKPLYDRYGAGDQLFWDTFTDLKFKAFECREIHGVWGNFVAFWYPIFYRGDIVKLGCLEFENSTYYFDRDYTFGDITVKEGDKVKSVHIPSSGEPFDRQARLDSYRRAYDLYRNELGDRPLICVCDSWLLYPEYRQLLAAGSNILSFMDEMDIVTTRDAESFGDAWRVFGKEHQCEPSALPEKTSLQRAFKKHLLAGGKVGSGQCVLIFDGERIINN